MTDDGRSGSAFPVTPVYREDPRHGTQCETDCGLSPRQYACIHLCVPESDKPWLDELIRKARRMELAAQAFGGVLAFVAHGITHGLEPAIPGGGEAEPQHFARVAFTFADALLAEEEKDE